MFVTFFGVSCVIFFFFFFFQAEDGIRDVAVTGVQTCALPISMLKEILGVLQDDPSSRRRWFHEDYFDLFVRETGGERSEEHTSELQSRLHLVCRLLLEKKKKT